MTDRERFLALLAAFNLTPVLPGDKTSGFHDPPEGNNLQLVADQGGVDGYTGFFCEWRFDETGKFAGVFVWE